MQNYKQKFPTKVLVIDADHQANTSTCLRLDETDNWYKGILNIFENTQMEPMEVINQNTFIAADKILCVSDVGIGAHKDIELFDYLLSKLAEESELDLKINAILLNKFKSRNNLSK